MDEGEDADRLALRVVQGGEGLEGLDLTLQAGQVPAREADPEPEMGERGAWTPLENLAAHRLEHGGGVIGARRHPDAPRLAGGPIRPLERATPARSNRLGA